MEPSTRPRHITSAEWDIYKAEILELFHTLDKTELLEHLKNKHGFCPTPDQYERQKRKWDLIKNITKEDWGYIKKMLDKRKRLNKKTQVVAHGRVISPSQLKRGVKRVAAKSDFLRQSPGKHYMSFVLDCPQLTMFKDSPGTAPEGIAISTPPHETSTSTCDSLDSPFTQFEILLEEYMERHCPDTFESNASSSSFGLYYAEINGLTASYGTISSGINIQAEPSDVLLQDEAARFNGHNAIPQSSEQDNFIFRGKKLLVELLDGDIEPNSATFVEQMECLLRKVVVREREEDFHRHAQQLAQAPSSQQPFHILRYMIYLCSNNLLETWQVDRILCWISDSNYFCIVEGLMASPSPTMAMFATSLLNSAVRLEKTSIVSKLLEISQTSRSTCDSWCHRSTLDEAVLVGNITVLRLLIEVGGQVPSRRWENLFLKKQDNLSDENYRENVKFVIAHCSDLNKDDNGDDDDDDDDDDYDQSTLLDAVVASGDVEAASMFLQAGAQVNKLPTRSATPLQAAAGYGNLEMVKLLINAGADIDTPIGTSIKATDLSLRSTAWYSALATPLQIAVARGNTAVAEVLLQHGANANGFDATPYWDTWRDENLYENKANYQCAEPAPADFWNEEIGLSCTGLILVQSPLREAAAKGNSTLVRRLLRFGAELNSMRGPGTALQAAAASEGNLGLVKYLVSQGADVNSPAYTIGGRTALQAAIEFGDTETVHFLLESHADVNSDPCLVHGKTALQAAVHKNDLILTKLLIVSGANVNGKASSASSITCLSIASEIGNMQMVELLLKHGAEPNAALSKGSKGLTALQAAIAGEHILVAAKLLDHGADPDMGNASYGRSYPLLDSVRRMQPEMTRLLLERGADPNPNDDQPPLPVAICNNDMKTAKLLIESGADVNAPKESYFNFPIFGNMSNLAAAATHSVPLCSLLIEAGAESQGNQGTAALYSAVSSHRSDVVQFLLSKGISPNWERNSQLNERIDLSSPIAKVFTGGLRSEMSNKEEIAGMLLSHGACISSDEYFEPSVCDTSLHMIRRLIDAGLNVNCPTGGARESMLQYAVRNGMEDVRKLLLTAGADVNPPACKGHTTLSGAVSSQDLTMAELLLSKGADVNIKSPNPYDFTILQQAVESGSMSLVVLLLKAGADVNARSRGNGDLTALDIAAGDGRLDIAHLLVQKYREADTLQMRCRQAAAQSREHGFHVLANQLEKWGGYTASL